MPETSVPVTNAGENLRRRDNDANSLQPCGDIRTPPPSEVVTKYGNMYV